MISLKVSYSNKISLRVLLCESYDNDDGSSGSDNEMRWEYEIKH